MEIKDFKTNYKPTEHDKDWTIRTFKALGNNNYWMTSSAKYKVDLSNKILTLNEWVDGKEEGVAIVIKVVQSIGWTVNMEVDETLVDNVFMLSEDPDTSLEILEKAREAAGT
jgi:hypothetical protein